MKWRMLLLITALLMLVHPLSAQVNVTLNLRNPMPYLLSVWESDRTVLQLVLVTTTTYPDVRLSFTITNSANTTVAHSIDNSLPHFVLATGSTVKFGPDLVN